MDHTIPVSRGGQDHPQNYFLMPRKVNNYFGNSWTAEKVAYIGPEAAQAAGRHRWHGLTLKASLKGKLHMHIPQTSVLQAGRSSRETQVARSEGGLAGHPVHPKHGCTGAAHL
jgi:hypothetical protein